MMGQVVQLLIKLEAEAAQRLFRIQNELEIWRTHLAVYDAVADRGLVLWDALSTHLPVRRWFRLSRLHRTVELLHQTLLQGTADLAYLVTSTDSCVARIHEAVQLLEDGFDAEVTAYPVADGAVTYPSVQHALAQEGVMGQVREDGERVHLQAKRVQAKYKDLIDTIGAAFDERRVRESDALQKASAIMGLGLAVVGVVTVLDATVNMKPDDAGLIFAGVAWLARAAAIVSLVLGAAFAAVALSVLGSTVRLGRLGSPWFRRMYNGRARSRYYQRLVQSRFGAWFFSRGGREPWEDRVRRDGMWSYLKDSSTDVLAGFPGDRCAPVSDDEPGRWASRDDDLARRFVRLWDGAARADLHPRWPAPRTGSDLEFRSEVIRRDIWLLARRIEQWSLHTLLITERPWEMYKHRLPKLTLLYRACRFLPGSFVGDAGRDVVSDNDLIMTMHDVGLSHEQTEEIDRVLQNQAKAIPADCRAPARDMLGVLNGWHLEPQLNSTGIARLLTAVRRSAE
jgi:hypothetical protein